MRTARPSKTIDCEGGQENDRFAIFLTTLTQRPNIEMGRMGYFGFRRAEWCLKKELKNGVSLNGENELLIGYFWRRSVRK